MQVGKWCDTVKGEHDAAVSRQMLRQPPVGGRKPSDNAGPLNDKTRMQVHAAPSLRSDLLIKLYNRINYSAQLILADIHFQFAVLGKNRIM